MKIGITGAVGYVGRYLMTYPDTVKIEGDVSDHKAMIAEMERKRPDLVIHLAAKTDVDWCEKNQPLVDQSILWGTANVADACQKVDAGCVILSTFHVFKGNKWGLSYRENEAPEPVNYYGMAKLASENAARAFDRVKVVRTGYLFDHERMSYHIYLLNRTDEENYPTFQYRSFIHLHHFAKELMGKYMPRFDDMPYLLHISGSETVSWFEFMTYLARAVGAKHLPLPRQKENNLDYAPRPRRAGLNNRLSYSLGFDRYSYKEGIELLRYEV